MKKTKILFILVLISTFSYGEINRKNDSLLFNKLDSIKILLDSLSVEEPYYVISQALYESGWFKCKKCSWSSGNNMFGFAHKKNSYLKFNKWQDGVVYYANWQKERYPKYKKKYPNGTYLEFLKWCKYAESPSYSRDIQSIYNWINKNWKTQDK